MPRLDGRLAGGSIATGGGFGAVGVSGGGGGGEALAFGAFGVGGGWTYAVGRRLSASTRPSSLATLPKPVASINLTKSLFSIFALCTLRGLGEGVPVVQGRWRFAGTFYAL